MSGGYFNHTEAYIEYIKTGIEDVIDDKLLGLSDEVIDVLNEAVKTLQKAKVYVHRIDYFLSGDDGEESFFRRLKEDMERL
jgi:hypothetical protein